MVEWLPHWNASLNALATVLLVTGWVLIKRRRERAHKRIMLSCFGVSVLFLASYVVYHALAGSKRFPAAAPPLARGTYFAILITHVALAATVPVLALITITHGLRDRRVRHRWWARLTFPIWLYVSVTGVLVYLMLYHWYSVPS